MARHLGDTAAESRRPRGANSARSSDTNTAKAALSWYRSFLQSVCREKENISRYIYY